MTDKINAIKQLYKIMSIEGVSRQSGVLAREKALDAWLSEYLFQSESSQSIIKTNLTSEDQDFIKYRLSQIIGGELMDNGCIELDIKNNLVKARTISLRMK